MIIHPKKNTYKKQFHNNIIIISKPPKKNPKPSQNMFNHIPFNHNTHISHIYTHPNGCNLWVGDQQAARDPLLLKRLLINAVLTVADGVQIDYNCFRNSGIGQIQHFVVRAHDMPSYKIRQHFGQTNKFIYEKLVAGRNVLVHCVAGISRSVAVIIAFLIRKLNFTFKTALAHVQSRRPIANPNYGFIEQLKIYETKLEQKQKRVYSSVKSHTESDHHHVNQIALLLQRRRQKQKQMLSYAFQSNRNKNTLKLKLDRNNHRYASSYEKSKITQKYHGGKQQEKMIKQERQKIKLKINTSRNQKPHKKRIDTQNTILFPRIVLVKKLEELDKKN